MCYLHVLPTVLVIVYFSRGDVWVTIIDTFCVRFRIGLVNVLFLPSGGCGDKVTQYPDGTLEPGASRCSETGCKVVWCRTEDMFVVVQTYTYVYALINVI